MIDVIYSPSHVAVLGCHSFNHGLILACSLLVVTACLVLLTLAKLQLLKHFAKTVDITLKTSDSSANFRCHKLAFGDFSLDIQLPILWNFHGKHELSQGEIELFIEVDAFRFDIEMND